MSLLRQLVDQNLREENESLAIFEAALLVRQAGLEHLVTEATEEEVVALACAGERLVAEHATVLARAFRAPEEVSRIFDKGESLRRSFMRHALAAVRAKEKG